MCWLYSIPNLLIIQHLETLYLGGNNVRAVCDKVWRIDQVCAIKRFLATGTCDRLTSSDSLESSTPVKHARSWRVRIAGSLRDKKVQSSHSANWWLELATCPSREWLASALCFAKKWLFTFLLIFYYKYPYTHEM